MPRKTDFQRLSKIDLAAALGVSTQTLDQWLGRGMPFASKPGTGARAYAFDLSEVLRWRIDYERARADAASTETDLEEAKRRKAVADARLAEMQADREAGRLLAREDVDAAVIAAFSRVRARLLAIPQSTAPLVVGVETVAEASEKIRRAIYGALAELAETDVDALVTGAGDD